jgi:signal transduction histidine kinase/ligand-binding sensor domain-containing protein/DNA-binding response OmpR family regulator
MDRGLSHPAVFCALQDAQGYMWFGTQNGLNRYDGYSFLIFRNIPNDTTSIAHNWITCLCESKLDSTVMWIGTNGGGLHKFNKKSGVFTRYLFSETSQNFFPDSTINALLCDGHRSVWIGTSNGLYRLNMDSKKLEAIPLINRQQTAIRILSLSQDHHKDIWAGTDGNGLYRIHHESINEEQHFYFQTDDSSSVAANTINVIYEDGNNELWAGTEGYGLIHIDRTSTSYTFYKNKNALLLGGGANKIRDITEDKSGVMWVATAGAGVNTFDRQTGVFYVHKCPENTVCCLGNNINHDVICDKSGIIWLATDCCGMNKHIPERMAIAYKDTDLRNASKISQNRVWSFWEDSYGVLWIATSDGLKERPPQSNTFTHHSCEPGNPATISNQAVTIIFEDSRKRLWIGTEDGLNLFNRSSRTFKRFLFDPNNATSLSDNGIIAIEEDYLGNIWVGTRLGGLNRYHPGTGLFERIDYDPQKNLSMANSSIMTILQSRSKKSLWIGSFNAGLIEYDFATGHFNHFVHEHGNENSISHNTVYSIFEDENGMLWLGTNGGGLNRFDPKTGEMKFYHEKDGLLSDQILNMIGDQYKNIWISTSKGLCIFNPTSEKFFTFHRADDLHSNLFDRGAFYKNDRGEFYYGTAEGIHKFSPDSLIFDAMTPNIVLTRLEVNNIPGSFADVNTYDRLKLKYDQNSLLFEAAVLDYRNPNANKYAFRLLGMDHDWIHTEYDRTIKYTNLSPGNYTLEVKGCNADGVWSQATLELPIRISPPPWRTWWAFIFYVLLIAGVIYTFWQATLKRERLNNQLKFERFQAERLQELDQLKSRFFANISHEFRSPLTLIMGPLEKIADKLKGSELRDETSLMKKNAEKILRLINQLLDLSRLESGKMLLRVKEQNIVSFLKETMLSFSALAESKNTSLTFLSDKDDVTLFFDAEVMDKIMTNLLANAIKFTPPNGVVTLSFIHSTKLSPEFKSNEAQYKQNNVWDRWVQISVSDTGPGIPADKIDEIFEHFYQYAGNRSNGDSAGSGIGLALVKELVELHKGRIVVSSTVGVGTIFTITLPAGRGHYAPHEIEDHLSTDPKIESRQDWNNGNGKKAAASIDDIEELLDNDGLSRVLVVDDNQDIRTYIRKTLSGKYHIDEAADGQEGWKKAIEDIPDLVISDVVMPEMNGIKLCNNLKADERTNHIPIILLTVRASDEDRVEGLKYGADEYMTKPFDANELLARVNNLITQRQRLREYYNKSLSLSDVASKDIDHRFLQRAIRIVEKHLSDPDFSVSTFCHELGTSRPQLHRKLTALTNQSTSKFIRTIRLKHAASMLATHSDNVFGVAQEVGFNNLSYFAKCFHEQYGMSPSEYLAKSPKPSKKI